MNQAIIDALHIFGPQTIAQLRTRVNLRRVQPTDQWHVRQAVLSLVKQGEVQYSGGRATLLLGLNPKTRMTAEQTPPKLRGFEQTNSKGELQC